MLKKVPGILGEAFNCAALAESVFLSASIESQNIIKPKVTFDQFTPGFEYRFGASPDYEVARDYLKSMEKIPDQIQKIVDKEGGYFVF